MSASTSGEKPQNCMDWKPQSGHVEAELDGGVLLLTLNRPDKKNAITGAMYADLADGLDFADSRDEVRAVLVSGRGGSFTAGNDLADFLNRPQIAGQAPGPRFIHRLRTLETPLVAAVSGHAVGIGSTMLLHCDFVFADETARFQFPFINLALVQEAGASLLLPQRAGRLLAAELLMLGETFDADKALIAGLVGDVVGEGDAFDCALACARHLAEKPAAALRAVKRLLRQPDAEALHKIMDAELASFQERLTSAEAREVFTAFLEKRKPDFTKLS